MSTEERERAIELAIQDVRVHNISIRRAAEQRGIPRQTLKGRLQGRQERHKAHENEQLLSPLEELEVVEVCRRMERRFLPVRTTHVVACAQMILNRRLGTTDAQLGNNWIEHFLDRHPELTLTTSKRIDERRVMAKNPAYVMEFYVMLANVLKKYGITPDRIFNMDEKGYQIGITGKEKVVIVKHDYRDGYAGGSKDYGNRETVTTIDCICADGTVLPPMIIMKGKYVLHQWIASSPLPKETLWAASPLGWTDNELAVESISKHSPRLMVF